MAISPADLVPEAPAQSPAASSGIPQPSSFPRVHYFGDYELLEEIARGGMGVVYKARQVSLNRIVAVKMILTGQLATEAEVKRFHTEAEAAANLQHPNIVAIHEVGIHEGQHYFSMDYVEGKNMAQTTGGKPIAPERAARYLKTIAEAVHYAHQRGTLHRDLKPSNILMDANDQPRITDFGLAKRIEQESDLTRSGAVMGSPSYMPPEQAAGRMAEVGPSSDVYSLGAILYELLTGRAPFKKETPTATLVQVLEEEPVPPRTLTPGAPLDLETICLKCLEKRPERRYASARLLAEELERFLNHEPILARPASRFRRGWIWLQKHPWAITGLALLVILGLSCTAYGMWQKSRYLLWQTTHPEQVFRPGFQPLLITSWFFMQSLWAPCAWADQVLRRHFRRHRENGSPIPRSVVYLTAFTGAAVLVYGLALFFKLVEMWAWHSCMAWSMVLMLSGIGFLWHGAVLLWKAMGANEQSIFSQLVAQQMEQVDALDELFRLRAPRKGLKVCLYLLTDVFLIFVLPFWFLVVMVISHNHARPGGSPMLAVWAGLAAWLVPLPLFWRRSGDQFSRPAFGKRLALTVTALLGAGIVSARETSWPLGLAMAIGGGLLGGLTVVLASWKKQIDAQRKRTPKAPLLRLSDLSLQGTENLAGGALVFIVMIVPFGIHTILTWRYAGADYAYLDRLSATGKVLPRQSYLLRQVPDEVNFVKTPGLQAIGWKARLDTNSWAQFVTCAALLDQKAALRSRPNPSGAPSPSPTNAAAPDQKAQAAEVLRALAPLEASLEELRQAATRPYAQLDPAPLNDSLPDPNEPHWPAYRLLGRLLLAHAGAELELGSPTPALRDLRVVQRLADALNGNRRFASTTMRVDLVRMCQEGFWLGWAANRWVEPDLRQWENWLGAVDLLRDLDISLRGEEPLIVNSIYDAPAAGYQMVPFLGPPWFRDQLLYNQIMFGFCEASFDAVSQVVYPTRTRAFQQRAAKTLKEAAAGILQSLQTPSALCPNLDSLLPKVANVQTAVNLSRIAAALTRYRMDTGQLPSTLEELAPRYLARVPHDLVGGKPLIYHRAADSTYSLYSLGWNERDDGGVAPIPPSDLSHGDWIWPGAAMSASALNRWDGSIDKFCQTQ